MNNQPLAPSSERGIALIVVLLLLAVMSGLVTGMTMNGQVEVAMASNEVNYAGARAAAEAGINRAIEAVLADSTHNLLAGEDDTAGTADDGDVGFLMSGFTGWPEAIGAGGQFSYTISILDDDDPSLYADVLSADQLAAMNEDNDPVNSINDRYILRATGFGPNGTTVNISRMIESVDSTTPGTNTSVLSNPAILVNGDMTMNGNFSIEGLAGNVHANGNVEVIGGTGSISGDLTATGTVTSSWHADGAQSGGAPTINVPNVNAADYMGEADFFLNADGTAHLGSAAGAACGAACTGWTFSGGQWSISGNTAPTGTFYVDGTVSISGSPGSAKAPMALSVIATGSISVTGRPFLTPENAALLQFVTDGDLFLGGAVDADDPTTVEGKSLVREQLSITGNPVLQQQIIVQNVASVSSLVTANSISGNVTITYNGSFAPIDTPIFKPGVTSYINNISGWLES